MALLFLRHGGSPPDALHKSGLHGHTTVHGKPKFTEGQLQTIRVQITAETIPCAWLWPELTCACCCSENQALSAKG